MTEHDYENVRFLLSVSKETLEHWYDSVSEADHEYAKEILTLYSLECLDRYNETYIAEKLLQKYRLNS